MIKFNSKGIGFKVLTLALTVLAVAFGADSSFAMAIDAVDLASNPNPSTDMGDYNATTNPEGRPAGEGLQADEQGYKTQLQNHATTATDVRDAGLEADDYDEAIVNFRKFAFPVETYIATKCTPVKVASYVHSHYRSGSTNLTAEYNGTAVTVAKGATTLSIAVSSFTNPEALTEYSTVILSGVDGFGKDDAGTEYKDGPLALFVLNHNDDSDNIKFQVINPPVSTASVTIPSGTEFLVCATACSESQMRVAPESYLPEKHEVYLQKKISSCIITDEFKEQSKKVKFIASDIKQNALYNFKRKCARSHWLGRKARLDVKVKELNGNREADYFEDGIIRQIPMLYTHGDNLTENDFLAISSLMFTDNSVSESAVAFCGKRAIQRIAAMANSAVHYKDFDKVTANELGIEVRKWRDNFGSIEFVWDRTLDDVGYQDYMVVWDPSTAVRYYKRNEKESTIDMKKTGEAREAEITNISRIDCVALKGYNAVLVCPASMASSAANVGGIVAQFVSIDDIASATDVTKYYYLTEATGGFLKGSVIQYDSTLKSWIEFTGLVRA